MCHHLDHLSAAEWDTEEEAETPPTTAEDEETPIDPDLVVPTPT